MNSKTCYGPYSRHPQEGAVLAKQLFGLSAEKTFTAETGEVFIGDRRDLGAYRQDVVKPSESFRLVGVPLAGKAGLDEALRQGILRYATEKDIDAWFGQYDKTHNRIISPKEDKTRRSYTWRSGKVYVILKPFQVPAGLHGAHSVTFILQAAAPYPRGDLGHSTLLQMSDGACIGSACHYGIMGK